MLHVRKLIFTCKEELIFCIYKGEIVQKASVVNSTGGFALTLSLTS